MPTVERNKFARDPHDKRGRNDYQGNHDVYEMPEAQKPGWRPRPRTSYKMMLVWAVGVVFIASVTFAIVELYRESGSIVG